MNETPATQPAQPRWTRRHLLGLPVLGGAAVVLAACGEKAVEKGPADMIAWPAKDIWPDSLAEKAPEIQEAYRWVAANKETIRWFPCYCGCVDTDHHTSNFDCYIKEEYDDGSVLIDQHSYG